MSTCSHVASIASCFNATWSLSAGWLASYNVHGNTAKYLAIPCTTFMHPHPIKIKTRTMQIDSGPIIIGIIASFDGCALEGLFDGGIDVLFGQELFGWRVGS